MTASSGRCETPRFATRSASTTRVPLLRQKFPVWTPPGRRWAALIIPFSGLCAAQFLGRVVPPLERTAKVAEVLPNDPKAQLNYGKALHEAG